jgi:hypothetical protein
MTPHPAFFKSLPSADHARWEAFTGKTAVLDG